MSAPLVTVGIPFFDEARFLEPAVRSILAQSVRDIEVLLVDDGSSDGSLGLARTFQEDPRVRVISDGARKRLPARLNEIVREARAPLVARMDADDVAHPSRLAKQIAKLREGEGPDAVGTWVGLVDETGAPFAVVEGSDEAPTAATALERGLLPHATVVARRDWLRANPYDESMTRAEDRELWCRTVATSTFGVVREPLYVVRVRPDEPGFLADYAESQRQNRALYLEYGATAVGFQRTAALWLGSHAKVLAMRAAKRAGLARRVVRRRGRTPTSSELGLIAEAFAAARAQRE